MLSLFSTRAFLDAKGAQMLSYRHSFHAGNHADVIKHVVEVAILSYLLQKDKPLCYHDTHAGAGLYSVHGQHAQKTGEYQTGIGKLFDYQANSPALARYIELIKSLNPDGTLNYYPGSPSIARLMLRATDSIQATELHPSDFPLLQSQFSGRRFCRIENMDAYAGVRAMLPPLPKRGLVLIDPPYELKHEYQDLLKGVQHVHQRFPQATIAIWYPVIERAAIEAVLDAIAATGIKNQLRIEYSPLPDRDGFGMTGSGMLVINPPYTLAQEMHQVLTELDPLLAQQQSHWQIEQRVPE
jgi:23S rRNA (adenine2030-N6)-methyltransferase